MQIKDKRAILIGVSGQLGISFCRELIRNGAGNIVLIDNCEVDKISLVVDEVNVEFGEKRVTFLPCELSKNNDLDAVFKEAVAFLGGLDILINNADLVNESDIAKAVDVNVTAVIRGTLLGLQQMGRDLNGKGGIIVNVTSTIGLDPLPQLPVYSTSKQAVIGFSRSFAQPYHYQRTGVKIVVLCPGLSGTSVGDNLKHFADDHSSVIEPEQMIIDQQKIDTIAHGLVYIIRCAQNGSVWVSENNQTVYEIQLPDVLPQKTKDLETLE